jgi:hypothetical protein
VTFAVKKRVEVTVLTVSGTPCSGNDSDFSGCGAVTTGEGGGQADPALVISNGSGSYTYLWQQVGTPAQSGPYNCSSATTRNPTWNNIVCDGDDPTSEDWQVTVTDSVTGEVATTQIGVTLIWTNLT